MTLPLDDLRVPGGCGSDGGKGEKDRAQRTRRRDESRRVEILLKTEMVLGKAW